MTKSIPLDASLVRGSHGAPAVSLEQQGVVLSSCPDLLTGDPIAETDLCDLVLGLFRQA